MSYSICRISKIKSSGVTGIQIHDRREKESVSHTNKDIDWNKTKENICLMNHDDKFKTIIQNRIHDLKLKRAPRKDATVMAQCLITSDKAFFDKMSKDQQVEFFKKSYEFIENRYGKENMISANIHFDEKTPHMHINFVPVTKDNRLSARDLFSPQKLRTLQDDFNKFCNQNNYDLERGELNTKRKHLSVEEYKLQTQEQEAQKLKQKLENTHNALKHDFKTVQGVKSNIHDIEHLDTKKSLLGGKMTLKKDDYEKLIAMAKQGVYKTDKLKAFERENARLKTDIKSLRNELSKYTGIDAMLERSTEKEKMTNLKNELKKANREGEAMFKVLEKHKLVPEAQKEHESMLKAEKVAKKVLRQSHDMER